MYLKLTDGMDLGELEKIFVELSKPDVHRSISVGELVQIVEYPGLLRVATHLARGSGYFYEYVSTRDIDALAWEILTTIAEGTPLAFDKCLEARAAIDRLAKRGLKPFTRNDLLMAQQAEKLRKRKEAEAEAVLKQERTKDQRKLHGQCLMCGKPLGIFNKLYHRLQHKDCHYFIE